MIVDIVKYNFVRRALAERNTPEEERDMIHIPPRLMAIKKLHDEETLTAALEILQDPRITTGITPIDTMISLHPDMKTIPPELALYIMVCYAIALQQDWIVYSKILNKYRLNTVNAFAVEYVEDMQGIKVR